MPKVSVIVPCYNSAGELGKCLQGLEDQTFRDMDVILVDDCSADDTYAFLLAYQKQSGLNVKVLKNERNSGPAYSRNEGIRTSNAEYIAFCDSDDWYDPTFLHAMTDAAGKNDADIVFCNSKRVFASGKTINCNVVGHFPFAGTLEDVLAMGVDSLPAIMVRHSIIAQHPLPDLRNGEDIAILPVLIAASRHFAFVEQCNYNYFYRPGSLSTKKNAAIISSLLNSFQFIRAHLMDQYPKACEYLGVRIILYGTVLNAYQSGLRTGNVRAIVSDFERDYPSWHENRYLSLLPLRKRLFVHLVRSRRFLFVRVLCTFHTMLLKTGIG